MRILFPLHSMERSCQAPDGISISGPIGALVRVEYGLDGGLLAVVAQELLEQVRLAHEGVDREVAGDRHALDARDGRRVGQQFGAIGQRGAQARQDAGQQR